MEVFDDETIEGEKIHFIALLQPSLGRGDPASSSSQRRLVSNYGLRLNEIVLLWLHLLVRGFDVGDRRDQLLWTLYWLRVYAPESACVTHFRPTPTEKTYRAAVKKFVGFIANLNLVRWERRFEDWQVKKPSFSIDGTDCRIYLPAERLAVRPVGRGGDHGSGAFISHKSNMAALRYYVCMHICKPIIVLAGGGYPAGSRHDLTVARDSVAPLMRDDERGIADHGYHDDSLFLTPLKSNSRLRRVLPPAFLDAFHESMSHVRGRQEHVNAELKEWTVIGGVFRHHPTFHPECFRAVCELTQLRLELQPSIIPPPQYSPLFIDADDRLRILKFNEDGTVADIATL